MWDLKDAKTELFELEKQREIREADDLKMLARNVSGKKTNNLH